MILTFGKHKGRRIGDVPGSYLEWAVGKPDMWAWFRKACAEELCRRRGETEEARREWERASAGDMPKAPPQVVCGVLLDNPYESGEFERAKAIGVLVKTPDMPVASLLPEAWRRWCEQHGVEHCVKVVTWEEIKETIKGKEAARMTRTGDAPVRRPRGEKAGHLSS